MSYTSFFTEWHGKPGAAAADIAALMVAYPVTWPWDYLDFLAESNGGEGRCGAMYFSFWPAQEIAGLNRGYNLAKYLGPAVIGIGSDGGPECIALEFSGSMAALVTVPFGDLDPASIRRIGVSLQDGLSRCRDLTYRPIA